MKKLMLVALTAIVGTRVFLVAAPTCAISRYWPLGEATAASTLVYRVKFSEAVVGFDSADVEIVATAQSPDPEVRLWGINSDYYVLLAGLRGVGTTGLRIKGLGSGITSVTGESFAGAEVGSESFERIAAARIYGWGPNFEGQVGSGSGDHVYRPIAVQGGIGNDPVVAVAAGTSASLAVCASGVCFGWGSNRDGQSGIVETSSYKPEAWPAYPALSREKVISLASGSNFSGCLSQSGDVFMFGRNTDGCLGDGSDVSHSIPAAVAIPGGEPIVALALGDAHALALDARGRVFAWGSNAYGQIGDGTAVNRPLPVQINGALEGRTIVRVAAGSSFSLALADDGVVYAWGANDSGQLGDGSTQTRTQPVVVGLTALAGEKVTQVAVGSSHALALTTSGRVFAWGANSRFQLGDFGYLGSNVTAAIPVAEDVLPRADPVVIVAARSSDSFAVTRSGQLWAWGQAFYGSLGIDSSARYGYGRVGDALLSRRVLCLASDSAGAHSLAIVDGGATVTSVELPKPGVYGIGSALEFTLKFSAQVDVDVSSGIPQLLLQVGDGDYVAEYVSGSGSDTLVFKHLIQINESGPDGARIVGVIELHGGTLRDADGIEVQTRFVPSQTSEVSIDGVPPAMPAIVSGTGSTVCGVSEPAALVFVYADGVLQGSTRADAEGNWQFNLFVGGTPSITVTARDAAGNASAASEDFEFQVRHAVRRIARYRSTSQYSASDLLEFLVEFDGNVSGVDPSDFSISSRGANVGSVRRVSGSGSTYWIQVGPASGSGEVRLEMNKSGTGIVDDAGNLVATSMDDGESYICVGSALLVGLGENASGQLNDGSLSDRNAAVEPCGDVWRKTRGWKPTADWELFGGQPVARAFGIGEGSFAIARDGTAFWWGFYHNQEMDGLDHQTPLPIGLPGLVEVAGFDGNYFAVTRDGWCYQWRVFFPSGADEAARVGHFTLPMRVQGSLSGREVVAVSTGRAFPMTTVALALTSDGVVHSWGTDASPLLVRGDSGAPQSLPHPIGGALVGEKIVSVAVGEDVAAVLTADGRVYNWGELVGPDGHQRTVVTPELATGELEGLPARMISVGGGRLMAIAESGQVFSWGPDAYPAAGDGSSASMAQPKEVKGPLTGERGVAIFCAGQVAWVMTESGRWYSWGAPISSLPCETELPGMAGKVLVDSSVQSGQKLFVVADAQPVVRALIPSVDGRYGVGESVDLVVRYSHPVVVDTDNAAPRIMLTVGATPAAATYVGGSGTTHLLFRYIVADGAYDTDGIGWSHYIDLNGSSIHDALGVGARLDLPPRHGELVCIDALQPTVPVITGLQGATLNGVSLNATNVEVWMDARKLGEAMVDAEGNWSYDVGESGRHSFTAVGVRNTGRSSGVSAGFVGMPVHGVSKIGRRVPQQAITSRGRVTFSVTFDGPVTGVDAADFALVLSGEVQASISAVAGSGSDYDVTVAGLTGEGTIRLDLREAGTDILDASRNPVRGGYSAGETYQRRLSPPYHAGSYYRFSVYSTGASQVAKFNDPSDIAHDAAGNFYVPDARGHTIRKVTPEGVVTTLAGRSEMPGSADGTGDRARFFRPAAIAFSPDGALYVSDEGNSTIRRVTLDGVVTTYAGQPGRRGHGDGPRGDAQFDGVAGMCFDGAGALLLADSNNCVLRQISPDGVVSTIAGRVGESGYRNGPVDQALFTNPRDVCVGPDGSVFVADASGDSLRRIVGGQVGSFSSGGSADGFYWSLAGTTSVAADSSGNVFVGGPGGMLWKAPPDGRPVSRIAGAYSSDVFFGFEGIDVMPDGDLYVAGDVISRVTEQGAVSVLAGMAARGVVADFGSADGVGASPGFADLGNLALGTTGDLFIAAQEKVWLVPPGADASVYYGANGGTEFHGSTTDIPGLGVEFDIDVAGDLFIADRLNGTVSRIGRDGILKTIAGSPWNWGSADGLGASARFTNPSGIAVGPGGICYVADSGNCTIRLVTPAGEVSTLAGVAGQDGAIDGAGTSARFFEPTDLVSDTSGNAYVIDGQMVRKVTPQGVVSTLAGAVGEPGSTDGQPGTGRFYNPRRIAVDPAGYVYVSDWYDSRLRKIAPDGSVMTIVDVQSDSTTPFEAIGGIAVEEDGAIFVSDRARRVVYRGIPAADPPTIQQQPIGWHAAAGDRIELSVEASATVGTLNYQWYLDGVAIEGATHNTYVIPYAQQYQAGSYTVRVFADGTGILSQGAYVNVDPAPSSESRLLNLSTRALDLQGDNVLIPGFVIQGTGTKRILLRAVGPGMWDTAKLAGYLENPKLWLRNQITGAEIASNDDWGAGENAPEIAATAEAVGAFPLKDGSKDAALLLDLPAGYYTAPTVGLDGGTGIAMVEIYDADPDNTGGAHLVNISNRGFVDVGDKIMIPGFVVSDEGARTFLIRAVGPGLFTSAGLTGVLEDPVLTVFHGGEAILRNDDWDTGPGAAHTAETMDQVGAYALEPGSKDAAFVVTLPPGVYTIQATGKNGTTGVALVEVYLVP